MQPSDGFWEGVGASVGSSPGWMVIGALLVIGVLFVFAKYVYPGWKELKMKRDESAREIKMRELDIRQREADNDAERIKANAALAENMRGLRESNDQLAKQSAALAAGIEESKARSRSMSGAVDRIDSTTQHTDTLVEDIHKHIFREGTE